MKFLFRI